MGFLLFVWVDVIGHNPIRGSINGAVTRRVAAALDHRDKRQGVAKGAFIITLYTII